MIHAVAIGRVRRDRGFNVARPSVLGNPFAIGRDGTRSDVIARYRDWLDDAVRTQPRVRAALDRIVAAARERDVMLLCYCAPEPCHAEVVAEFVRRIIDGRGDADASVATRQTR